MRLVNLIQFPPEMDENWVRYGLAKLGQISKLPNWQRMLFCAYTTQLLHSTGEVCWNNKDSYFIWFEICVQKLRTDSFQEVLEAICPEFLHTNFKPNKITILVIPTYFTC